MIQRASLESSPHLCWFLCNVLFDIPSTCDIVLNDLLWLGESCCNFWTRLSLSNSSGWPNLLMGAASKIPVLRQFLSLCFHMLETVATNTPNSLMHADKPPYTTKDSPLWYFVCLITPQTDLTQYRSPSCVYFFTHSVVKMCDGYFDHN